MSKHMITRAIAIGGTIIIWFTIVLPFFFSFIRLVQARRLLFDYLMPAEVFPVVLAGALLLVWAAIRAGSYRALIGWSLAAILAALTAAVGLAAISGMASGRTEPAGLPFVLVNVFFAIMWAALISLGVGGILLLRLLARVERAAGA